jgi:hypothetical protein
MGVQQTKPAQKLLWTKKWKPTVPTDIETGTDTPAAGYPPKSMCLAADRTTAIPHL